MADEKQPIIIKKVIEGGHGHHGGAWKVAYADFVTALMALFIVLWILGQSDEVKENIAGYFNDPTGFGVGNGPSAIEGPGRNEIAPKEMTLMQRKQMEKERLDEMGQELIENLGDQDFRDIVDQIEIEFAEEGLRIEIMESANDAFFEVGTAELKAESAQILSVIGTKLAQSENKIIIEGHTDARPFSNRGQTYTNYELSADRANSARRVLQKSGIPEERIVEIRGYAANKLRNEENPYDVVNRRISIIVKYSEE